MSRSSICNIFSAVGTAVTAITAVVALFLAKAPLEQADLHMRWQNYNELNARYADLYKDLSAEIDADDKAINPATRRWTRRYFDLTSEEYWLHKEGLLPPLTWECRIAPGVTRNFREHRFLSSAYERWKQEATNIHPGDFVDVIDSIRHSPPPCPTRK